MEQNQIQINNVEDLVNLIEEVEIPFNEYLKVVDAYFGVPLYWIGTECKKKLIARIRVLPTDSKAVLPIIINI